jgi:hypothetical protein
MKKVVFISVPYSCDPDRGVELSKLGGEYVRISGKIPFSPVLNFRHFYDNGNEYETVLADCIEMIKRCDEALFIETEDGLSKGQNVEYAAAVGDKPCEKVNYEILAALVNLKTKQPCRCLNFNEGSLA